MRSTLVNSFVLLTLATLGLTSDINAQAWNYMFSPGFSPTATSSVSMAMGPGNIPYVAFSDGVGSGNCKVMRYNGAGWDSVGASITHCADGDRNVSLAFDHFGTAYLFYSDDSGSTGATSVNSATVKKFNGSNWVNVGAPEFSISNISACNLLVDDSNRLYVAFMDGFSGSSSGTARVMIYNGSAWEDLSPVFHHSVTYDFFSSASWHNILYIAYCDSNHKITVQQYSGGSWSVVGSEEFTTVGGGSTFALTIDTLTGTPYLAFVNDPVYVSLSVMKFDGSDWVNVGPPNFTGPTGSGGTIAIDGTGTPFVAFSDGGVSTPYAASAMKYTGGSWSYLGVHGFSAGNAYNISMVFDESNMPYVGFVDGGFGDRASVMAYISPPPAIGGTTTVCIGSTTLLTDAESSGTWSSSNMSVATVGSLIGVVTGITTGIAVISYTTIAGTVTQTVTVITTLSPGSIAGASALCASSTTTVSDAVAGGAWSSSNAAIAQVSSAGAITGIGGGTVTISYSVTNSCGTSYAVKSVTVDTGVSAGSITGADTVCVSASVTVSDMVPGGTWNSSNAAIAQVTGGVIAGITAGIATISYLVTNSCGTAVAAQTVTVNSCTTGAAITIATTGALTIVPNPNNGSFTLHISSQQSETAAIIITNMLGEKVKEFVSYTNTDAEIQLNEPPGVYFISAVMKGGTVTSKIQLE